jgi:hypothetical protein
MRATWAIRAALPLATAAMMIGCSKGNRHDEPQRDRLGGVKYQIESLKGCLQKAPGGDEYVLAHVQLPPVSAQLSDAVSGHGLTVTEGSSVRLSDASDELKSHLGHMVSVTGTIIDDGRNTIGTAGKVNGPSAAESPVDASRAASDESGAAKVRKEAGPIAQTSQSNGNVPEMAVERVTATGDACGQ